MLLTSGFKQKKQLLTGNHKKISKDINGIKVTLYLLIDSLSPESSGLEIWAPKNQTFLGLKFDTQNGGAPGTHDSYPPWT